MTKSKAWLMKLGFQEVGYFTLQENHINVSLRHASNESGVYAFLIGNDVMYVGETGTGLLNTISSSLRPVPRQKTRLRIKESIMRALRRGQRVDILFIGMSTINELEPIEMAGEKILITRRILERILIDHLRPPWNKR